METTKERVIRKLTSRKLWAAVAAFVAGILAYSGASDGSAESITGLIMAGASVVAYIVGEGLVDRAKAGGEQTENYRMTRV